MTRGEQDEVGTIVEAMPNAMYRVETTAGHQVLCHIGSEARRHITRILPGERVELRRSLLDTTRGRITRRVG